jgi:hypothetical protein
MITSQKEKKLSYLERLTNIEALCNALAQGCQSFTKYQKREKYTK